MVFCQVIILDLVTSQYGEDNNVFGIFLTHILVFKVLR